MKSIKPVESFHANDLYLQLITQVFLDGDQAVPRGEKTIEIRPMVFRLTQPWNRLITLPARKINPAFALIEAFQLIAGTTDGAQQARFNANIKNWLGREDGQIEAPYGIIIKDQLPKMLDLLQRDPDSRQAVMTVYDGKDHFRPMLNVPCTCDLQFFVRNGRLELITHMRSSDLWWGLPYDLFQFTALQEVVAAALDWPMGNYTHIAGSGHLYEPHFEAAQALCEFVTRSPERVLPPVLQAEQELLFGECLYKDIQHGVEDVLNLECRVAAREIGKDEAVQLLDPPFSTHLSTLLLRQRLDR